MESSDEIDVDQERLRFSQAVVALTSLAAFVFQAPIVNPVLAGVVLLTLGPQPRDFLATPFDRWLAPRVREPSREPIGRARLIRVTSIVLLGASGFWWIVGALGLGELFGLLGTAAAASYATTGIVVVANAVGVVRRTRRRGRRSRRAND